MDNRSSLSGQIAAEQNQLISVSDENAELLDVSQREAIINSSTDWCLCGQCSRACQEKQYAVTTSRNFKISWSLAEDALRSKRFFNLNSCLKRDCSTTES